MDPRAFVHEADLTLADGTEAGAVGAAVTAALCGHWEHEGPCRWPHHNQIDGHHFRTIFVATGDDEPEVRRRIREALNGQAEWQVDADQARDLIADERELSERLLRSPRLGIRDWQRRMSEASTYRLAHSVEVDVTPAFAWRYRTDIETWRDPPAAFELDGPFVVGARGRTRIPGREPIDWMISRVQAGRSYRIEIPLDGAVLAFDWLFEPISTMRTRMTQRIALSGHRAAAYVDEVRAGFGATIKDGMGQLADAMSNASRRLEK